MTVLDPLADPQWDARLAGLHGATTFHTRAWAEVLARAYGFPRRYAVLEQGGALAALLPVMEVRAWSGRVRGVALPFSDFVPVAAVGVEPERELIAGLLRQGAGWGWQSLEWRGGSAPDPSAPPFRRFLRHEVDLLADEAAMFRGLKAETRTAVRKAEAGGVTVKRAAGGEGLADFCRLNALTRRRHGVPPQPARFFDAIADLLLRPGRGEIWLALHGERAIASAMFLTHGDQALFKYGCSDARFQHLRPNDLLFWRAFRDLAQRGLRRLCLGRTELAHEGLRRFKAGLGANEETVAYYKYDFGHSAFVIDSAGDGSWYNGLFRAMPLWVSRVVGSLLYRFAA